MTTEDDFLHALHESPENDELRLIFADWLEDRVDPRGPLMRTQVLLSMLPADDLMRLELDEQERLLLAEKEPEWLRPLRGLIDGWSASRGLLHLDADGSRLLRVEFSEEQRRLLRWVTSLRLTLQPRGVRRLAGLGFL